MFPPGEGKVFVRLLNYLNQLSSFLSSLVILVVSSTLVRMVGVRITNNSVFFFDLEVLLNRYPIRGISPRIGTLLSTVL